MVLTHSHNVLYNIFEFEFAAVFRLLGVIFNVFFSDHEYEPIGDSIDTAPIQDSSLQQDLPNQESPANREDNLVDASSITSHERKLLRSAGDEEEEEEEDHDEDRLFAPTPQTDHSRNDEICTSQVDSSAIEDLPLRKQFNFWSFSFFFLNKL